ncbi:MULTISPECIES: RNA 2',3'-cyclic phosphodiesterase [Dehalobacter]|jgi:2'-5' RNA ligase|uniref:RNA 2',3'-cyclic phosphodiesterase n=2 Tax=Dehalobacter restrictus TaxID=55583 RepID=A0A857DHM2_9FIRM|nr:MULTISPECIES: RNA 2',3'-cyclic phosphodiesterase [Dehalobacter]AHF09689.1 2'-5' RNA ligase [Dehalobacter restrictus DSM 9455]MCG1025623.1 RNA 2',3'-cyclic phosphodiesterase [Dehalobacter sp.]MDJ0306537.1 RNA 2',3'-cyclic phosphodiesterase [Dehalobacter sp.]OCZ51566.1 2'-5' RNA ligase [Dehalobacter sp. TeCB1]QHA00283.1 RNA 2',3'-cyclic phosphodiesterase [Dehalobacter restrictus]
MRLFISLNFSEHSLDQFEKWQDELKVKGLRGYWRRRDNLHLTLRFLEEVEEKDLDALQQTLTGVSGRIGEFAVAFDSLGVFPNIIQPRILWAGIRKEPKLIQLQKQIQHATSQFGAPPDTRPFKPHLTLASGGIKGIDQNILNWGSTLDLKETAVHYALMQSKVEKGIRQYLTVARYRI